MKSVSEFRAGESQTPSKPRTLGCAEIFGCPSNGFSPQQLRKLSRDLDCRHTHTREVDGRQLTYIEGWYAISQANEIFGYSGWDRETVHFERVSERSTSAAVTCSYLARVRIRVRAGTTEVIREGTGWGSASASSPSAANELALKAAETDATKRALMTFGGRFGLMLYNKDNSAKIKRGSALWGSDGRLFADGLSPEGFSTGLRQLIELCRDHREVDQLFRNNAAAIDKLRNDAPDLVNVHGVHFGDLLRRLFHRSKNSYRYGTGVPQPRRVAIGAKIQ